jgi:Rha family phage regulatory protein
MQDIPQVFDDLTPVNGQPMTTSRKVAARFKKAHKTVLRSIKKIEAVQPEFSRLNFVPRDYVDARGKLQPEYAMTRDGFALLAMGFTGDAAMTWKVIYINAFNKMAEEIARASHVPAVPLTLHEQALKLHAEAKTSEALATIYGRGLRKRRDDKPVFARQLEQLERAMQICLFLGLDGLPDVD